MKVLVVGNGGREHAIAWKLSQSPDIKAIFVAPGNAGTLDIRVTQNIPINVTEIDKLIDFAKTQAIDLTIVGPEAPLAAGIQEAFSDAGLMCFAPSSKAAQLESSKSFSKQFMEKHHIPTAKFATFTDAPAALDYLKTQTYPIVIKADGLAAGKGVVIAETPEEATKTVESMLSGSALGEAGKKIVIEEFIAGFELSYIVMCDGKHFLPLASSQDHKRRDNGDQGPNTGGMGAFSPSPFLTDELEKKIQETVIQPVLDGMQQAGTPYVGFLYAGLMITPQGDIRTLEYNCRLGDPETQPIMMRLISDLAPLCIAACKGELSQQSIQWDPRYALSVVLTAGGYPKKYHVGDIIQGLPTINDKFVYVFHAGTTIKENQLVTNGGRVLAVTALGDTLRDAYERAYAAAEKIHWNNCFYRTDIGLQAIIKTIN